MLIWQFDFNNQKSKVRLDTRCPNCLETKQVGLLLCWPCHHSQKRHNDGDYSKRCKSRIVQRESALRAQS